MPSLQHKILHKILLALAGPLNARFSTLESRRRRMEKLASWFKVPAGVAIERLDIGGMQAEWLIPLRSLAQKCILYFHGGGYVMGSLDTHRHLMARIARAAHTRVLAVAYRLAPEHPFPAAVEDARAAFHWLLQQGFAPNDLMVAGDSAGGGLALALLLALREAGESLPAAAVCLSPWTDLAGTGTSLRTHARYDPIVIPEGLYKVAALYLAGADPQTPLASPLYADLHGLPQIFIQVGTKEALLDDSVRFADRARNAGVEVTLETWKDMMHVWQFFAPLLPESQQAISQIGRFIQKIHQPADFV